jgi:PilZ domain
MKKTGFIELSREHTQMLVDLRNLLRAHGVTISLTDRHTVLPLINASISIEDDRVQKIRSRLVALLPESQDCLLSGEPYEKVTCGHCGEPLYLVSTTPLQQYVACSCGQLLLFIIEDKRAYLRQSVRLQGLYRYEGENSRIGEMIVENLSYGGARLRTLTPHDVSLNDQLIISFTLNDNAQTIIHKAVYVVHVKDDIMGVRFLEPAHLEYSLAIYLGINWLKK